MLKGWGRVLVAISMLAVFGGARPSDAQQALVGVLYPGPPALDALEPFRQGLGELGYVEGRNIKVEWRFANGNERLEELAVELVRLRVSVIVAINTPATQAAKKASASIPIVAVRIADPVRTGLVASLARPGGNITGLSAVTGELSAKRLQLLKEALPRATRVAVIWDASNPGQRWPSPSCKAPVPGSACSCRSFRSEPWETSPRPSGRPPRSEPMRC